MGHLIVEAVSGETRFMDVAGRLVLFVSVSLPGTGAPVTGLKAQHFRVCAPAGSVYGLTLESAEEARWESPQRETAGCYSINIALQSDVKIPETREWIEGEFYAFAIQVRCADASGASHMGQTVVRIESLGK